jgi:hypothetical protein
VQDACLSCFNKSNNIIRRKQFVVDESSYIYTGYAACHVLDFNGNMFTNQSCEQHDFITLRLYDTSVEWPKTEIWDWAKISYAVHLFLHI